MNTTTDNTNTLKSRILHATRRCVKKGLTVGEIYDRLTNDNTFTYPNYASVRSQVYKMETAGDLEFVSFRKDKVSKRTSCTFRRTDIARS